MTTPKKSAAPAQKGREGGETADLRAQVAALEAAVDRLTVAVQEAARGTYDVEVLKREIHDVVDRAVAARDVEGSP